MPSTNSSSGCQCRPNSRCILVPPQKETATLGRRHIGVGRQTGRWLKGWIRTATRVRWFHQMVLLTPAHTERFMPWAAWTSFQCRRVLGTSSSASGSLRAPSAGRATIIGKGPHSCWNSTTFNCFRSARVWWVSYCPERKGAQFGKRQKDSQE